MFRITGFAVVLATALLWARSSISAEGKLLPIPERLVVLTFDDGTKTDITTVAPILKRYGFGATFFVTNLHDVLPQTSPTGWQSNAFMSWEDIRKLNELGFEIGNHTVDHPNVTRITREKLLTELQGVEEGCRAHGIPRPITFVYPGFHNNLQAAQVLLEKGYQFARRGVGPEFFDDDNGGRGAAYDPAKHHPLFIPTTAYAGPHLSFEDFVWAVDQAKDGKISVLTFHGVPYPAAPWVTIEPKDFERYMKYLHDHRCKVIAVRDLAKYVKPASTTSIPLRQGEGPYSDKEQGP